MSSLPLEREAILPRVDGIRQNLVRLYELGKLPLDDFSTGDNYDLAQHHLRLALEGVLNIGAHILSRLPGGRPVEYAQIAEKLGELGIVPRVFANDNLVPMAKMRNILVHHYADIDPARIYAVVRDHLGDIETFLHYVALLLEKPEAHGLKLA